jgi:hypothetical protein
MFNSYEMEKEIERHRDLANEKGHTVHLRLPDKPSLLRRFLNRFRVSRKTHPAAPEEPQSKRVLRAGH